MSVDGVTVYEVAREYCFTSLDPTRKAPCTPPPEFPPVPGRVDSPTSPVHYPYSVLERELQSFRGVGLHSRSGDVNGYLSLPGQSGDL